jgi:hypothetical protein
LLADKSVVSSGETILAAPAETKALPKRDEPELLSAGDGPAEEPEKAVSEAVSEISADNTAEPAISAETEIQNESETVPGPAADPE